MPGIRGKTEAVKHRILACLAEADRPMGAQQVSRFLAGAGFGLQPRTVRLYLERLDREGLTRLVSRRRGRALTAAGRRRLSREAPGERRDCVLARMQGLRAAGNARGGALPVHLVLVRRADLSRSLAEMRPFFSRSLGMGCRLALLREGEDETGLRIPPGHAGFCLPSNLGLANALADAGVAARPWAGCLVEMRGREPIALCEYARYEAGTHLPEALYLKAGMTGVRGLARGGGRILASIFLLPPGAQRVLNIVLRAWRERGPGRALLQVPPGGTILGLYPPTGFGALLAASSLNTVAVVREAGVGIELIPLAGVLPPARLQTIDEVRRDAWREAP